MGDQAALVLTEAEPAELSPEETKEGLQRYTDRLTEFQTEMKRVFHNFLLIHWKQGQFAQDLASQPGHYGNATLDTLAGDLDISRSTLFACWKFQRLYTMGAVEQLAAQMVPWRAVAAILTLDDEQQRADLTAQVSSKAITADDVIKHVKAYNQQGKALAKVTGKKADDRGGVRPVTTARSFLSCCQELLTKIGDFKEAYQAFDQMEEGEARSALAAVIKESYVGLRDLQEAIAKLDSFRQLMVERRRARQVKITDKEK